jgi:dynein heavy chain
MPAIEELIDVCV